MKLRQFVAGASLMAGSVIALSSPANAFSFQTNYTSSLTGNDAAKGDIFLNSVTLGDGSTISDFTLINAANIVSNDIYTGGNSGAASADIGDMATTGLRQEALTNEGAQAVMNNLNLNNIIDTEDKGSFVLDLKFEQAVDNIFLWERGMNSRLDLQALDASGNVIGNLLKLANSRTWDDAGFDINTNEIRRAQNVGSIGISLMDLGVTADSISALRISSHGKAYNGPDFKLLGSVASVDSEEVPEPSALIGLGAVVAGMVASRRKQAQPA
ncbi:MAG: exosortase-dependent surface protein XDP2 [Cyanobacteria bacterium P01_F01_bin.3]